MQLARSVGAGHLSRTRGISGSWVVVATSTALWTAGIGWLATLRHLNFLTGFDLGIFSHIVWTTSQGRPFHQSLMEGTSNFLNIHFVPLLAALTPLYLAWPDPRLLLIVQAAALASATIPLYAFARKRIGSELALVLAACYLLSPVVHWIALDEFHEIALALPLLLAAGAGLLGRRDRATLVWLALALLVKEEVALIAVGFGLYALVVQRRWRYGAAMLAGALLWTGLLYTVLMPSLRQNGGGTNFAQHYGSLGKTPAEMIRTLLTRPQAVIRVLATRVKLDFVWHLLAPLGGLPLIGLPALLLALPPLAYLLLGDDGFQVDWHFHYTAVLIPFLFLASACALERLRSRAKATVRTAAGLALAASLLTAYTWSPLPGGMASIFEDFGVSAEARATQALLAKIPPDAAVAADSPFQPWLANRWWLADIRNPPFEQFSPAPAVDYVVQRIPTPYGTTEPAYPWVLRDLLEGPLRIPRYSVVEATPGGVTLWRRLGPEQDVTLQHYEVPFEWGLRLAAAGMSPEGPAWGNVVHAQRGTVLPVWMAWGADQRLDRRVTFTLQLMRADGTRVAQADSEMGGGHFPVTRWHTWLDFPVVAGEFRLELPPDLPPGRYTLMAGAYDTEKVAPLMRPTGEQFVQLTELDIR